MPNVEFLPLRCGKHKLKVVDKMQEKICPDCHHSLENNNHGFDQNDFEWLEAEETFIHSGRCTYCEVCNPRIFEVSDDK